jgi:transcription antitermination factor NusA-like protein
MKRILQYLLVAIFSLTLVLGVGNVINSNKTAQAATTTQVKTVSSLDLSNQATAQVYIDNGWLQASYDATEGAPKVNLSKGHAMIYLSPASWAFAGGMNNLEIGKATIVLPKSRQLPNETFTENQLVKVYIEGVKDTPKGPKAMISRTHSGLVRRLFETEVPEIYDGIVEIKAVSREAGSRTKIAVISKDENVDPIGACIGPKGARVGTIVEALGGEKIDIVIYDEDPTKFIAAALAPADVLKVEIDEEREKACHVTVPDTQLSLAIGNKGQNVSLAARLTGWKIDIKPESGFYIPQSK